MTVEDISRLINLKSESKNLDYKERLNWLCNDNVGKWEIVKDILAMANTQDGGQIVLGVKDSDFEFVGLSKQDFISFDQTKVNDFLHKYTDPKHSCQVYKQKIDDKSVIVIGVPEFQEEPIICKKDAGDNKKQILKEGGIYIRTDKASSELVPSAQEMRELLGRAITKKGDELLNHIARLIKGKPIKASEESEEKYQAEIKEADRFFAETIGDELKGHGYWEVYAYPTEYNPKRITKHEDIRNLITKSEVSLQSGRFPHTDYLDSPRNTSNFNTGWQSYRTHRQSCCSEGYRAYQSGLFVFKQEFVEDARNINYNGQPVLEFVDVIYSVTEFLLFFKRYYGEFAQENDLHIKIVLNGTKNRQLYSERALLERCYVSKEEPIPFEKNIKVVELKASYREIANQIIRDIFVIFNWNDADETMIDEWQTKLIEKGL